MGDSSKSKKHKKKHKEKHKEKKKHRKKSEKKRQRETTVGEELEQAERAAKCSKHADTADTGRQAARVASQPPVVPVAAVALKQFEAAGRRVMMAPMTEAQAAAAPRPKPTMDAATREMWRRHNMVAVDEGGARVHHCASARSFLHWALLWMTADESRE
jgi:hypothetical protein